MMMCCLFLVLGVYGVPCGEQVMKKQSMSSLTCSKDLGVGARKKHSTVKVGSVVTIRFRP